MREQAKEALLKAAWAPSLPVAPSLQVHNLGPVEAYVGTTECRPQGEETLSLLHLGPRVMNTL